MNRLARAGLIVAALLLAACGGRHATRGGSTHGSAVTSDTATGGAGWRDDLSRAQGNRYRDDQDSVPPPIDVSLLPEPVPRVEPRSLYGNKSPYTVLGQTYRVLPEARGYVERGIASFYGVKFHGYKTSSLEDYDMYKFTAASKVLPLPSYARVTNLANGKSVIVRVNDRGPFHENRIIDLSYAAAVKIGVWPKGTGLVEVRAIDPAHADETPPPDAILAGPPRAVAPSSATGVTAATRQERSAGAPAPIVGPPPAIYLQVGAFADAGNAERVAARLRAAHFAPVQVVQAEIDGRRVSRVRLGPLNDVERADEVTARIEDMGLPRPQLAVD